MFFVGAVGAYTMSTALDMAKKKRAGVTFTLPEWLLFALMWAFAMLCQVWLIAKLSIFRKHSQEVQSTPDSRPGSTTEVDVQYLDGWFTSPLSAYVIGTNAYFVAAVGALGVLLASLGVFVWYNKEYAAPKTSKKSGRSAVAWIATAFVAISVIGSLLVCVSHFLLSMLVVYNSPLVSEKHYWVIFVDAAVSYSFSFFFAGWTLFAWYLGVFSYKSYAMKVTTVVVGVITLLAVVTQLFAWGTGYDMLASCYDNIYTGEIYVDGEIGFCELQYAERRDHAGIWNWYFVNTILFMSFAALSTAAVSMTLCCARGADRYTTSESKHGGSGSDSDTVSQLNGNRVVTRSTSSAQSGTHFD